MRVERRRSVAVVHADREEGAAVADVDRQRPRKLPPVRSADQLKDVPQSPPSAVVNPAEVKHSA